MISYDLCTIIPAGVLFIISLVLLIILYPRVHHWVPIVCIVIGR